MRVRPTASQVGLTADQRRRNVAGAFRVDKDNAPRIKGRKLVVVDDVITTGATAEACARVLKRAGAARVDVLALAPRRRARRLRALILRERRLPPSYEGRCRIARL